MKKARHRLTFRKAPRNQMTIQKGCTGMHETPLSCP